MSEVSDAALALIQKTDEDQKSQRIAQPDAQTTAEEAQPPAPAPEPAVAAVTPEPTTPAAPEVQRVAEEAAAAVSQPAAVPVAPEATPPAPQPSAEERVQQALRQAAPTRAEVAAQQAQERPTPENPRDVPIRRTGAFSGVVQSAIDETPEDPLRPRRRTVNVQGGVKQKALLPVTALVAAQATAPITYPGPGASGRVSDGAAERFIRKCTEELWLKIVPG